MTFSKKAKTSLLVATVVAGSIVVGVDKINSIEKIENLESSIGEMKSRVKTQKIEIEINEHKYKEKVKELKEKSTELEEKEKELEKLSKELMETKTELKKSKEKLQIKKEKEKAASQKSSANVASVKSSQQAKGTPIQITMTFYGSNIDGMSDITASGKKCAAGMVASNYYPIGTKFSYNGQIYTVMDRGGKGLNGPNNLDVYVPRKAGESDSQYRKRLYQYGRKTVTMYKL